MSRADAESVLSKEFRFSVDDEGYMLIWFLDERKRNPNEDDGSCAAAHFDRTGTLNALMFAPCYFNAADMSVDAFINQISRSYSIKMECTFEPPSPAEMELWRQTQGLLGSRPTITRKCIGTSKAGEKVEFANGRLMVLRRSESQRPNFN